MRILVSGMVAGDPRQGGASWAVLQYVEGFRRLGHDVWLVEPVDELTGAVTSYFRDVARAFGLEERAALLRRSTLETVGTPYAELADAARGSDVLLDIAGLLRDESLFELVPERVYLDLDPAFTQHWAEEGIDMRLDGHTRFATVGLRLGAPDCAAPTLGREWIRILPPVVLERWPPARRIRFDGFTTVGNWRSYGAVEAGGVRHGQRAHTVRRLIELPAHTEATIMPALSIHPDEEADLRALADHGWHLMSAEELAATPARYYDFVQASRAELGLPKEGYVVSRCGWFSDRSACYLASGRPVLLQDTGFSAVLPAGEGLLAYSDVDTAAAGIDAILADYERHRRAARRIAEDLLDSDVVLERLLACL
jgi:hypothetical protein